MASYRYLVFTNPVDGLEAEYNAWYDNIHLGEVIAVPHFRSAERYRLEPNEDGADPHHRYLAIYEFDADDPRAVLEDLSARAFDGRLDMQPVLDDDIRTVLYKVITPRMSR